TGLTTTFPASAGSTSVPTAVRISGSFDGKMIKYDRNSKVCTAQDETGEADAIFILENGATLSNVIIGPNQAEGVHCKGICTLNNVWWIDVCEDAATFKQSSGTSYVNGGGAKGASDKVFQHNGFGTVSIKNFFLQNYGKLYRSCGNCSKNGSGSRHVVIDNVVAKSGGVLAGINTNYGDTARISNSCQNSNKICDKFEGTTDGEPKKIGSGPDGTHCIATNFRTSC
ncbi:family 3 polysaccharide lyase, partial [Kalaharituber pfeilii]